MPRGNRPRRARDGIQPYGGGGGRQQQGMRSYGGDDSMRRRVYVGNLAWEVDWKQLKDHMRNNDQLDVVHADVMMQRNGRSAGCGIVEYATQNQARRAIRELNDTEISGRMIFVREDRVSKDEGNSAPQDNYAPRGNYAPQDNYAPQQGSGKNIYVGNLPWRVSSEELEGIFSRYGSVVSADIATRGGSHTSLGWGKVSFRNARDAADAIASLNGTELDGRVLEVRYDLKSQDVPAPTGGNYGGGGGSASGPEYGVYVGNLPWSVTWQNLRDLFSPYGVINYADVATEGRGRREDGARSLGWGRVRFQDKSAADAAIRELDNYSLLGRQLVVREDLR